ncbi:MAG: 4-(cytidine 5'-diphospho)-2-C-methyl-D-erythritol kinase [Rikenellaceae bacterium]
MIYSANCKINLGLNIVNRREDGFHNLTTIMYPAYGLYDIVEVVKSEKFRFSSSGLEINCTSENNLSVKAYNIMEKEVGEPLPPLHIHLHKVTPFGAGLGGGSSDATFTLIAINELLKLGFSTEKLKELAAKLGSDTAFFVENTPQLCSGRGEITEPIELNLSGLYLTIVKPPIFISTAEAFSGIKPHKDDFNLKQLPLLDVKYWKNHLKNDFETHIFKKYQEIAKIKETLYKNGAIYSSMSGSGSALFSLSESKIDIKSFENDHFFTSYLIK